MMKNHLKVARLISSLLDNQFKIGRFEFGLDPIIGLIPGIGDALGLLFSLYLLFIGWQMKIPSSALLTMLKNILLDFLIGSLPVVGDFADFFYKSNKMNLRILEDYSIEDVQKF